MSDPRKLPVLKLVGATLLCRREVAESLGRFHLPERAKLDHWINAPNVFVVLQKSRLPTRDPKLNELMTHVHEGDRIICYSHCNGPHELGKDEVILTIDQVLAVIPKPAA
jgi:hypothetical protein